VITPKAITDNTLARQSALVASTEQRLTVLVQRRILPVVQRDVDRTLNADAPKPSYPIPWQSEKQRKAYFATKGFGRGIPSKRTGKVRAWKARFVKRGGSYVIEAVNPVSYARYVYGPQQQRMHAGRWPDKDKALLDERPALLAAWHIVSNIAQGGK